MAAQDINTNLGQQDPSNSNFDSEDFDYDNEDSGIREGESILDKPLLNTFFDPEEILLNIERTYKGYQKVNGKWVYTNRPIARTKFINNTINMMRSVVNTQNFNMNLTSKEIDQILIEKNFEYIEMCRAEPKWSLSDDNVEMVCNIFDHVIQTFFGIVKNGRVSEIIVQIATGNYDRELFRGNSSGFKLSNPGIFNNWFSKK